MSRLVLVAALLALPMPALAANGYHHGAPNGKPAVHCPVEHVRPGGHDAHHANKHGKPCCKKMAKKHHDARCCARGKVARRFRWR